MSKPKFLQNYLPLLNGRALDAVKIIAAVCMVIDHINALLLDHASVGMYLIGRATYPLFCFALAIAIHKRDADYAFRTYGLRLMILALLCEPVSIFTRHEGVLNVIFTLAFGALLAGASLKMKDWQTYACVLLLAVLDYFSPVVEFGPLGIALPALILMALRQRPGALYALAACLFSVNILMQGDALSIHLWFVYALTGFATLLLPPAVLQLCRTLPQTGRMVHKYALHVFYPGHLVILWLIGRLMA